MAQGLAVAQQQSTCLACERSSVWSQHRAEKEERKERIRCKQRRGRESTRSRRQASRFSALLDLCDNSLGINKRGDRGLEFEVGGAKLKGPDLQEPWPSSRTDCRLRRGRGERALSSLWLRLTGDCEMLRVRVCPACLLVMKL